MRFFALVALTLVFPVADSLAATLHYVSPTGAFTWAQSTMSSQPTTLATANDSAQAGDVVVLQAGTYTTAIHPANSGASLTSRIVFLGSQASIGAAIVPGASLAFTHTSL